MSGLLSVQPVQAVQAMRSAFVSAPAAEADSLYWTADRVWATSAVGVGLIGVVLGGLALAGRLGHRSRRAALAAQCAGLVAALVGVLNLALADGGPGTGNGVVGGGIALVLGVAAVVVGRLARNRFRRYGAVGHQPGR
ncbi:DUF6223 family protein [Streptomyces sp. BYX5S]